MTPTQPYGPPLSSLLTLGKPVSKADWPDFRAMGFGPEYVPELLRMATDDELNLAPADTPAPWAPVYAWQALGQLGAASTVGPLLDYLERTCRDGHDDDYALELIPKVLATIGPAALPDLAAFARDESRAVYARNAAINALAELAKRHPDRRAECVAVLSELMERAERNDPADNGWLLAALVEVKAVEAAPAIERAFAAGLIDESIAGDWEWTRWELGLRPDQPQRVYDRNGPWGFKLPPELFPSNDVAPNTREREARAKAKAKRKEAAKSRKMNRKKKKR